LGGSAAASTDVMVKIWWNKAGADQELLLITHGDSDQGNLGIQKTGDGIKKIRIELVNDTEGALELGAFWHGIEE
jgi:hypothetical protein